MKVPLYARVCLIKIPTQLHYLIRFAKIAGLVVTVLFQKKSIMCEIYTVYKEIKRSRENIRNQAIRRHDRDVADLTDDYYLASFYVKEVLHTTCLS